MNPATLQWVRTRQKRATWRTACGRFRAYAWEGIWRLVDDARQTASGCRDTYECDSLDDCRLAAVEILDGTLSIPG